MSLIRSGGVQTPKRPRTRVSVASSEPDTAKPAPRPRTLLLGPASGLLLYLAFPPADRPFLAWLALAPLMALVSRDVVTTRKAYLSAWLGGLAFWVPSLVWIWEVHPAAWLAWLALALYQSAFWPLFLLFARSLSRRLPLMIAAPVAWAACEYIQAFALSGFPWYLLAHSQYTCLPLIQCSDLVGAWGVSILIVLVNVAVLDVVRYAIGGFHTGKWKPTRRIVMQGLSVVLTIGAALGYGYAALASARFTRGPRVVLLQSNLRQAAKMGLEPDRILQIFADLVRSAFVRPEREHRKADLVVWPETAYPFGWVSIDRHAGREALEAAGRQLVPNESLIGWFQRRNFGIEELNGWSRELGCPMLVGAPLYELGVSGGSKSNAAVWVDGVSEDPTIYRKMHLVPFGEYVPFLKVLPWIKLLAPYEDRQLPMLKAGRAPVWFDKRGLRYAVAICFEDTLPYLVRRFFFEAPDGRQPDVLINASNDGWFNGSAEHDMHLASGVFRAVENRVPIVRAANMGYSGVVDGNGQVLKRLDKKVEGTLTADVPLDTRTSLYTRWGDWVAQTCFLAAFAGLLWAMFGPIRSLLKWT